MKEKSNLEMRFIEHPLSSERRVSTERRDRQSSFSGRLYLPPPLAQKSLVLRACITVNAEMLCMTVSSRKKIGLSVFYTSIKKKLGGFTRLGALDEDDTDV